MPEKPTNKILAIDPGTREMGVAVLSGQDLEYFGVKTITDRQSPSAILLQGRQIVYRLIRFHRPDVLAIERPFLGYGSRSSVLVALSKELAHIGRDLGLEVAKISPQSVKKIVAGHGGATKREVAVVVCERFPELKIHLVQTRKYREKYWQNMFDAVGVALATSQRTQLAG